MGDPRGEPPYLATARALGSSRAKTRFALLPEGTVADHALKSGRAGWRKGSALQLLVALAVIAAALLDPFHTAIGVTGLVGIVLIDAGVHPGLARGFLRIFRIHGGRIHGRAGRRGGGRGRRGVLFSPWL